ncbi:hypothetical protein AB0O22_18715 [Streptomyces sp. NPDC091204]|uniref:hypothetical protein n=1 Tax=Streptomyces sp. NPDC091204 TaxID=3155299 RepID=UPI003445881F
MPLAAASGLTLAEDLCTHHPLPAFDTATMDGYAVAGPGPGPWRVRAVVRAGAAWGGRLVPGEGVEISTGALVPAGACAVLPVELAAGATAGCRGRRRPRAGTSAVPARTPRRGTPRRGPASPPPVYPGRSRAARARRLLRLRRLARTAPAAGRRSGHRR